jgi:hypothetical protein
MMCDASVVGVAPRAAVIALRRIEGLMGFQ